MANLQGRENVNERFNTGVRVEYCKIHKLILIHKPSYNIKLRLDHPLSNIRYLDEELVADASFTEW